MRLNIDPMPALRADAECKINRYFNTLAQQTAQQAQEHALKRQEAAAVAGGARPSAAFEAAATLENVTPAALADIILDKSDEIWERANQRRAAVLAVRAAKTPAELERIMADAGGQSLLNGMVVDNVHQII